MQERQTETQERTLLVERVAEKIPHGEKTLNRTENQAGKQTQEVDKTL